MKYELPDGQVEIILKFYEDASKGIDIYTKTKDGKLISLKNLTDTE